MPSRRALLAIAAAFLTACSSATEAISPSTTGRPSPPTTAPTTTEAPSTTTTVALPPPVPIDWSPCGGGFDCAAVTVPVDYTQPGGETLELAVIRRPARDPGRRIGTLVMNPGGPGASGVRRVRRGFTISPEVGARFDIVGFDPRGIGDSAPLRCGSTVTAFRSHDLAPDTPQEAAALATAARAVADECAAAEGDRLVHFGTRETVHDLEVLRRAIGEPQVSYVGLSYGTLIGLLWADAYPASVRAMVLDGVVDPTATGDATAEREVEDIDATFTEIDAACAADPTCPVLGAGGVHAAYDELARRLDAGEVGGHGVGPTQLAYAAFSATYDSDRWPLLWRALAAGLAGDLRGVADMADWFTGLVTYAPFALVSCLDADHPAGFDAWQRAADRAERASPRFGRIAANELLPCAFWPEATRKPRLVRARHAPPILVIGSTGDTATPLAQAEQVAADLHRGALLTVDLAGHIALGDSACASDTATRYLIDLTTPPPGARCP